MKQALVSPEERKEILKKIFNALRQSPMFKNYSVERIRDSAIKSEQLTFDKSVNRKEYIQAMHTKLLKIEKSYVMNSEEIIREISNAKIHATKPDAPAKTSATAMLGGAFPNPSEEYEGKKRDSEFVPLLPISRNINFSFIPGEQRPAPGSGPISHANPQQLSTSSQRQPPESSRADAIREQNEKSRMKFIHKDLPYSAPQQPIYKIYGKSRSDAERNTALRLLSEEEYQRARAKHNLPDKAKTEAKEAVPDEEAKRRKILGATNTSSFIGGREGLFGRGELIGRPEEAQKPMHIGGIGLGKIPALQKIVPGGVHRTGAAGSTSAAARINAGKGAPFQGSRKKAEEEQSDEEVYEGQVLGRADRKIRDREKPAEMTEGELRKIRLAEMVQSAKKEAEEMKKIVEMHRKLLPRWERQRAIFGELEETFQNMSKEKDMNEENEEVIRGIVQQMKKQIIILASEINEWQTSSFRKRLSGISGAFQHRKKADPEYLFCSTEDTSQKQKQAQTEKGKSFPHAESELPSEPKET